MRSRSLRLPAFGCARSCSKSTNGNGVDCSQVVTFSIHARYDALPRWTRRRRGRTDQIRFLIEAYDRTVAGGSGSASDHLLWLRPLDRTSAPLIAADLPRPILDAGRPVRLRFVGDQLEAWVCPNNVVRIRDGNQWMDDPHTPKLVTAKTVERFRLAAKPWDHSIQHQILFGGMRGQDEIHRPAILHTVDYRFVRICALGTDHRRLPSRRTAPTARPVAPAPRGNPSGRPDDRSRPPRGIPRA